MLHRIKSKSIHSCDIYIPGSPSYKFLIYFSIIEVYISTDKIIKVIKLIVYSIIPLFSIKLEECSLQMILIPVYSIEMIPIPCKIRIFAFSATRIFVPGDFLAAVTAA